MRITESQLRRMIREVIVENDKTLNEGFARDTLIPALMIMAALSRFGSSVDGVNRNNALDAFRHYLNNNPEVMRELTDVESSGDYEQLYDRARDAGISLDSRHDKEALRKFIEDAMRRSQSKLSHENPTKYSGRPGGMSSPDAPMSEQ